MHFLTLAILEIPEVREDKELDKQIVEAPVSYTHLDVYKRQVEASVMEVEEQPQVMDKQTKYVTIDCGFGYDKKVILEKWGDTP